MDAWDELRAALRKANVPDAVYRQVAAAYRDAGLAELARLAPRDLAAHLGRGDGRRDRERDARTVLRAALAVLKSMPAAGQSRAPVQTKGWRLGQPRVPFRPRVMTPPPRPTRPARPPGPSVGDLLGAAGLSASQADEMRPLGLATVADVRRAGDLRRRSGGRLPADAARRLEAHARLAPASPSLEVSRRLVERGWTSVLALSRLSPERLRREAGLRNGRAAAAFHGRLRAYGQLLQGAMSESLIRHAARGNGFEDVLGIPDADDLLDDGFWTDVFGGLSPQPEPCRTCTLCDSAASPFAYLAHLIAFLGDTWDITLDHMDDRLFLQDFRHLDWACDELPPVQRQVELCIEVLRRQVAKQNAGAGWTVDTAVPRIAGGPAWLVDLAARYLALLDVTAAQLTDPGIEPAVATRLHLTTQDRARLGEVAQALAGGTLDEAKLRQLRSRLEPILVGQFEGEMPCADADPARRAACLEQRDAALARLRERLATRLGALDEEMLPRLRDLLVTATGESAEALRRRLYIDCAQAPCRLTTRVQQAIESIQAFVLRVQTGNVAQYPPGEMDEVRWAWLRSYDVWRSAVLTFLYPENAVFPKIRRSASGPFREFLAALDAAGGDRAGIDAAILAYVGAVRGLENLYLLNAFAVGERILLVAGAHWATSSTWLAWYDPATEQWEPWRAPVDKPPDGILIAAHLVAGRYVKLVYLEEQHTLTEYTITWNTANLRFDGSLELSDSFEGPEGGLPAPTSRETDTGFYLHSAWNDPPQWRNIFSSSSETWGGWYESNVDSDLQPAPVVSVAGRTFAFWDTASPSRAIWWRVEDGPERRLAGPIFTGGTDDPASTILPPPHPRDDWFTRRWEESKRLWETHALHPEVLGFVEEAYLHVPLAVAAHHMRRGDFVTALRWYQLVYHWGTYFNGLTGRRERLVCYGAALDATAARFDGLSRWLRDTLDPHALARTRSGVYLRHALLMAARCHLEWADEEFLRDTGESLSRALELYSLALDLLGAEEFVNNGCETALGSLRLEILERFDRTHLGPALAAANGLRGLNGRAELSAAVRAVQEALRAGTSAVDRLARVEQIVRDARGRGRPRRALAGVVGSNGTRAIQLASVETRAAARLEGYLESALPLEDLLGRPWDSWGREPVFLDLAFCVPPNPLQAALAFRAAVGILKLRSCRNFVGEVRETPIYSADPTTLAAAEGAVTLGDLSLPALGTTPPRHRYATLRDRARQLVAMAQQVEGALLNTLQQEAAAEYDVLRANQDLALAEETVAVRALYVEEARNQIELAALQRDIARRNETFWEGRVQGDFWGLSFLELNAIIGAGIQGLINFGTEGAMIGAAIGGGTAGSAGAGAGTAVGTTAAGPAGGLFGALAVGGTAAGAGAIVGGLAGLWFGMVPLLAEYERRWEDWTLQRDLSRLEADAADAGVRGAELRHTIATREGSIAVLQQDHAKAVVNFLAERFLNADVLEWMTNVLLEVYRELMKAAVYTARLAQAALSFERRGVLEDPQDPVAIVTPTGYWRADRKGLTGAERLALDIERLDQYRLETERRKHQLTKTVSLAQLLPIEFQTFRQTGEVSFFTQMRWFDEDFPGHYLRLIKSVRVSVIALVPSIQGIRATLTNHGVSQVVVGPGPAAAGFTTKTIERFRESIALSGALGATGLFALDPGDPMLLPFEGSGVATGWTLSMPRAANPLLNFETMMDVLLTIDYTALEDPAYRDQVRAALGPRRSWNAVFSLRQKFPDLWYHVNNPRFDATGEAIFEFRTEAVHFPAALRPDSLVVTALTLVARRPATIVDPITLRLEFTPDRAPTSGPTTLGGQATSSAEGLFSTMPATATSGVSASSGYAANWLPLQGTSAVGAWRLTLSGDPARNVYDAQGRMRGIDDLTLVVACEGETL
jgi:hypothetical protein